jgi:hypothetical protein
VDGSRLTIRFDKAGEKWRVDDFSAEGVTTSARTALDG